MPDQPPTQDRELLDLAETDDRLLWVLRRAGDEWGPLGVALTAALLSDPNVVVQNLVVAGAAQPIGRKRLRAILTGRRGLDPIATVDEQIAPAPVRLYLGADTPAAPLGQVLDPERAIVGDALPLGYHVPSPQHPAALRTYAAGLVLFDGHTLRIEYDGDPEPILRRERDEAVEDAERYAAALTALERQRDEARERADHAERSCAEASRVIDDLRDRIAPLTTDATPPEGEDPSRDEPPVTEEDAKRPHPITEDPRRPRLDHFPDDAILLTYREIRRLLALHLEGCGSSVLSGHGLAQAMREGEAPLRLAEVLDR